jgi:hypothetical protein
VKWFDPAEKHLPSVFGCACIPDLAPESIAKARQDALKNLEIVY